MRATKKTVVTALFGTAGRTFSDFEDGTMLLHKLGEAACENDYRPSRHGFAGDSVFAALQHFVDGLRHGTAFETDGTDYLRTLAVQETVYRSAASLMPEPVLPPGVDPPVG